MVAFSSPVAITENLCREIRQASRSRGGEKLWDDLRVAFIKGEVALEQLSLRTLYEELAPDGRRAVRYFNQPDGVDLQEAESVRHSDFQRILPLALSSTVLREYALATADVNRLANTVQTSLERERIPGVGGTGDMEQMIPEAQPYPYAGLSADYVDTPMTEKHGFIVGVTKEAIFFDRTGLVQRRTADQAKFSALAKLKEVLRILTGVTNNHRYLDQSYDTYNAAGGLWQNLVPGNAFVNWKSIQAAELIRNKQRDPLNGELITFTGDKMLIGSPERQHDFNRIAGATQVRETDGTTETLSANPTSGYQSFTHELITDIQGNADDWYAGAPTDMITYLENWGITTTSRGAGGPRDFTHDIVAEYKVSRKGVAFAEQPRAMVKNTP